MNAIHLAWPVLLGACLFSAARGESFRDHLGLQLYSLRELNKTDLPGALDRTRAWGFVEVETAGTGGLPAANFRQMLEARGLKPVAAHVGIERLEAEFPAVLAEARALGVAYVICPSLPHPGGKFDDDDARRTAAKFNAWGDAFKAAGIRFGYHTHGFEFLPSAKGGGDRVFDVLVRETDPQLVCFEMDLVWVYDAGVDPAALLLKYPDRWALLHMKDMRRVAQAGQPAGARLEQVAVGSGEIDTAAVLRAAWKCGVRHYFIEDETSTPLACIPQSRQFLQKMQD